MKASELIEHLVEIIENLGDCEVAINTNHDVLWKYMHAVEHVRTSTYGNNDHIDEKIMLS